MQVYSHSRLNAFEQCRLRFKFQYIDKLETEIEETVEAFMGSRVHEVLEKLYNDVKLGKIPALQELLDFYAREWASNWNENILIVREGLSSVHFMERGKKFINNYYLRFHPFDQDITIATEQRILISLGKYELQGYIDRIAALPDGVYEIHDYKTSNTLPTVEDVRDDRQLKLYAIALKELYQDCRQVRLIWHYLAFDKDLVYEPSDEELLKVQESAVEVIKQIESAKEYPPKASALCSWCVFKPVCPEWKHSFEVAQKDLHDFFLDDGVALANRYVGLIESKDHVEAALEEAKAKLLDFADQKGVTAVFGSSVRLAIRTYPKLSFPKRDEPDREQFEELLKKLGLWQKVAEPDMFVLAKAINSGEVHEELVKLLDPFIERGKTVKIYVNKK